jgi:hypothetical protein
LSFARFNADTISALILLTILPFEELDNSNSFAVPSCDFQNRYGPQLENMTIGCAANWIDKVRDEPTLPWFKALNKS